MTGAPGAQIPDWHDSVPLQAFVSAHAVPLGTATCVTPVVGSQASTVQTLPSSSGGGVPAAQCPAASQTSRPLQTLPSPHELPVAATCVQPIVVQASVVHGFESSHELGEHTAV